MLSCKKIFFSLARSNYSKSFTPCLTQSTSQPSISPLSLSWSFVQVKHLSVTSVQLKQKRTKEERREWRKVRREKRWKILENIENMTDSFLKQWPTVHKYYRQIAEGNQYQMDAVRTWYGVSKTRRENSNYQTKYREEKAIFNFKNSLLKMTCLMPLFMMPMGIFIVMIPIAMFPQVALPRCYWSPKQRQKFLTQIHENRTSKYGIILHHLTYLKNHHPSAAFKRMLDELLTQINGQKVPTNNDLNKIRTWSQNEDNPLHISDAPPLLIVAFCQANSLLPYIPTSFAIHYLHKRALQIMDLDRKLERENLVPELSVVELQDATFVRGLNCTELSTEANRYWLTNWINLTKICDKSDTSFILLAMMLQSYNYTEVKYQRRIFD